jgi:hypothetical protein
MTPHPIFKYRMENGGRIRNKNKLTEFKDKFNGR